MEENSPGQSEPPEYVPESPQQPDAQPKRSRRKGFLISAGVIVAVLIAAAISRNLNKDPFEDALEQCDIIDTSFMPALGAGTADDGKTLLINGKGGEDDTGLSLDQLVCVINNLEVPTSIITKMESTRAMDGRQADSWGDFEASWTYHPNTGLDIIVTRK